MSPRGTTVSTPNIVCCILCLMHRQPMGPVHRSRSNCRPRARLRPPPCPSLPLHHYQHGRASGEMCPQVMRRINFRAHGRRTRVPARRRQTPPCPPYGRLSQYRVRQLRQWALRQPTRLHQTPPSQPYRRLYQCRVRQLGRQAPRQPTRFRQTPPSRPCRRPYQYRVRRLQPRRLRQSRASPPSKLRNSWPAATPSCTPVMSRQHGFFTSAQPMPGTGNRRYGWGQPLIRPFSTGLACTRSATRSKRNPGTAMRLTSARLSPIVRSRARRRNSHRKD